MNYPGGFFLSDDQPSSSKTDRWLAWVDENVEVGQHQQSAGNWSDLSSSGLRN